MKPIIAAITAMLVLFGNPALAQDTIETGSNQQKVDDHGHEHGGQDEEKDKEKDQQHDEKNQEHGHEEAENEGVELSAGQMKLAGIKVITLMPGLMDYQIYAPGELKANGYTSYFVSPRVDSVVLRRHVVLGEHVTKGQPLVTLFSERMVEAQAAYTMASSEWLRMKALGRTAVGAKRHINAQTELKVSYGRLVAYGLSDEAIKALLKNDAPLGEYVLHAAIDGVVLSDDFHQGQQVNAGGSLIELADESKLWVDASFPANKHLTLPAGTKAVVKVGHDSVPAVVIQEAHTIDQQTRTRVVRLQIDNPDDHLHSGMFADVFFAFSTPEAVMAVPETALIRSSDGDWIVFIEQQPGHFKAQEVTLGQSLNGAVGTSSLSGGQTVVQTAGDKWRAISGIKAGVRVVSEGAFFVASELAKGGFDPHNH